MTEPSDVGLSAGDDGLLRCAWGAGSADYRAYHDHEWGQPVTGDAELFEKVVLEGFQSGLSWLTILRKRPAFRDAFGWFDPATVAAFDDSDVERLVVDARIVRHRGKIVSAVNNARRALELIDEHGSLATFFWGFEPRPGSRPAVVDGTWLSTTSQTPDSTALSRALRRRGWTFVGPTTMYALMQATGIVNDHHDRCFARAATEAARVAVPRPPAHPEVSRVR